jgi:hypothetical protein
VLPGELRSSLKLVDRHLRRLKDDVLGVVQLPVARQDPALRVEILVERGPGERGNHRESGQVDAAVHGKLRRLQEDLRCVVIEAEDEASLKRDLPPVQLVDNARIVGGVVEPLAGRPQRLRRKRLESHEQSLAPAGGSEIQQRTVVAE